MRKGKSHFADVAVRYAEQIVAGEIPACWQIQTSCRFFLDDVAGDTWTLNAAKVERVCRFAETFPYLEGPLAAKKLTLRLEPWQVWILAALFGLVDSDGHRKHREAFIEIPRKNGKSTFAAVIALYMLVADYGARAQVYIGASNRNQASYCFEPCRDMALRSTGFVTHYGVAVTKQKVETRDGSFLERMIGDPPDGSNPHLAILDEAHENHNFSKQRKTMQTGMGARTQPLLITITTAGFNEAGDCRLLQAQCEQVLAGELTDARRFVQRKAACSIFVCSRKSWPLMPSWPAATARKPRRKLRVVVWPSSPFFVIASRSRLTVKRWGRWQITSMPSPARPTKSARALRTFRCRGWRAYRADCLTRSRALVRSVMRLETWPTR